MPCACTYRYYSSPGAASAQAAKARVVSAATKHYTSNGGVHQHSSQALPDEGQGRAGHQDRRLHTAAVALFLVVALALYFLYYRQAPGSGGLMSTLSGSINGRSPSGGLIGALGSSLVVTSGNGSTRAAPGGLPTSNSGCVGSPAGGTSKGGSTSPYRSMSGGLKRQHGA